MKPISEVVAKVFRNVDRALFLPDYEKKYKNIDEPLPIGYEQTTSQPSLIAGMIDLICPESWMRVLEIGTGYGYMSAMLSDLVKDVYSLERIPELAHAAIENLKIAGCSNVHVKIGFKMIEWIEKAPFNGIIVSAASRHIPDVLIDQLHVNGHLVIPVGDSYRQKLYRVTKTDIGVEAKFITYCRFVPLIANA